MLTPPRKKCSATLCDSRPMENRPPSPMFFKVKKTHEVSAPSQNGELPHQKNERKQQLSYSHQSHQSQSTSSDAGGSESEGGSLPPPFPDEDPERMRHSKIIVLLSQSHGLNILCERVCKGPQIEISSIYFTAVTGDGVTASGRNSIKCQKSGMSLVGNSRRKTCLHTA